MTRPRQSRYWTGSDIGGSREVYTIELALDETIRKLEKPSLEVSCPTRTPKTALGENPELLSGLPRRSKVP